MKKIKTSLAFIPFIAGGIICFYVTLWLGLAYLLVMALIGTVIVICKASSGAEEKIIALESYLNEPSSEENKTACEKILFLDLYPENDLEWRLYNRYQEAKAKYLVKYKEE